MSRSDIAVSVRGLSKAYTIAHNDERHVTLAEQVLSRIKNPFKRAQSETFWALRDVEFDIRKGDVVGIIGRNRAGKSTLLKILSRITEPTQGEIRLYGRVGSLLEVGTGFHPELTGRENIYLNGQILGMRKREIDKQFDAIVDFAGVEKFLDTPVKRYSSGMYVRLAFAVAAHLESEVLVVDEVLAVGDAEFQRKCLGKMQDVANSGRTVFFVSHNMAAVRQLCTQSLVLEKGRMLSHGAVEAAISAYLDSTSGAKGSVWQRQGHCSQPLQFTQIEIELTGSQPSHQLQVRAELRSTVEHAPAFLAVDILDMSGVAIAQALPTLQQFVASRPLTKVVTLEIDLPPLIPGTYSITLWAGSHNTETLDIVANCATFDVVQSPTPGRTFPHTFDHGYIVPASRVLNRGAMACPSLSSSGVVFTER
jgi:lipopolysaccharide transport system ATP-binding protein